MRIVHLLTRGDVLGGAQTHVRELSLELIRLGHRVTVITGTPGIFTDQLQQDGIACLQLRSMVRPIRPHRDLLALAQLWQVLRRLQPDVVCAHTAKAGSLGRAAAWLLGLPSVFTPHGWSMLDRSSIRSHPLYRWTECLAAHVGTSVINVCEFERDCARQFGVGSGRRLEVVHNGIAERSLARVRLVDAQPPTLIMVARFAAQKDHATLLQALSGLTGMEWTLLLVGAGELEPHVSRQVFDLGMRNRVRILKPETDVNRLLMGAQIFVLATHFEAFPISILEAMRAGLPVVATHVGGVPEAVRHEETGLLVRPRDVLGLRDALARVICDPALRVALGNAGQRLWAARFTARTMTTRSLEVYQRALAAHRGRRIFPLVPREPMGSGVKT
jgi:glycosyltransferase involved in cell wall biosynthesis